MFEQAVFVNKTFGVQPNRLSPFVLFVCTIPCEPHDQPSPSIQNTTELFLNVKLMSFAQENKTDETIQ